MKVLTDTPLVSKEVLNYLIRVFPDILPKDAEVTIDAIRYLQGQQSVIEKIRQLTETNEDED